MNTVEAIQKRSSCRKFLKQAVPEEALQALLDAAEAAPSGRDLQVLRFNLVERAELIETLSEAAYNNYPNGGQEVRARMAERQAVNLFYGAPVVLVITAKDSTYNQIDAGLATANVCLRAEELGLSTCIIAMARPAFEGADKAKIDEALGLDADERFMVSIAIGYQDGPRKEQHAVRPGAVRRIR